jgi:acyl dehydratase
VTRHFEDFTAGEVIDCGSVTVDEAEMLAFARRFDPQPFHVDPEAAARTPFGGIIASGFFTTSIWMRLYADAVLADSTSQGSPGLSELRWLAPVRAGDVLAGRVTVLGAAPSATRAGRGTVMLRGEFRGLFGRRPDPGGTSG